MGKVAVVTGGNKGVFLLQKCLYCLTLLLIVAPNHLVPCARSIFFTAERVTLISGRAENLVTGSSHTKGTVGTVLTEVPTLYL